MQAPVHKGQTIEEAFATILKANYDYMLTWEQVAYEGENIRGVHQTRVSFRRMRSALSVFGRVIPRDATMDMGVEMKWFASELGPARDSDVFIDEALGDENVKGIIPPPEGEAILTAQAKKINAEAYVQVRAAIDSDRFKAFKENFPAWIENCGWREKMTEEQIAGIEKKVTKFANKVLRKRFNKILAAGDDLSILPEEELHELRIRCKKVRYAMEFFTPLYDAEEMDVFGKAFKKVQRQLGIINDVAVMPGLLARFMEGIDDENAQTFANGLAELRRSQQKGAIDSLPGHWTNLGTIKLPWAKKERA
ncbi:CHAD domain-containing protein [Magnetococcales bacterium HHB-1]